MNKPNIIAPRIKRDLMFFFLLIAAVAFANGLSDSVLANYFKEAYDVSMTERAFIEFPRELPGFLCIFIIAGLSFIGDIRLALFAQVSACIGITVLGFFTPSFAVMLLFLFIYSTGMHLFMPLSEAIGLSLAEPEKLGRRVGHYGSVKTAIGFLTGILAFVGFRFGFFSFKTDLKVIFIISGAAFLVAVVFAFLLLRSATPHARVVFQKPKLTFAFRKEYRYYYILTTLHGVQKQIAYVFGTWVVVDLLSRGADTVSLLIICGNFLGILFFRFVGMWIEKKGVKFVMFLDAWSFIIIYIVYGIAVWWITYQVDASSSFAVAIIYGLFILDRLSMQIGVVKSVYLKRIAHSPEDVTKALSTGISLDHIVSILIAQLCGVVWAVAGPQWVFFLAAFFSIGNLFVASRVQE